MLVFSLKFKNLAKKRPLSFLLFIISYIYTVLLLLLFLMSQPLFVLSICIHQSHILASVHFLHMSLYCHTHTLHPSLPLLFLNLGLLQFKNNSSHHYSRSRCRSVVHLISFTLLSPPPFFCPFQFHISFPSNYQSCIYLSVSVSTYCQVFRVYRI